MKRVDFMSPTTRCREVYYVMLWWIGFLHMQGKNIGVGALNVRYQSSIIFGTDGYIRPLAHHTLTRIIPSTQWRTRVCGELNCGAYRLVL